jgi:hypothetical protein
MTWTVAAIGDFNQDGKSDLIFQNSVTGSIVEWQMNGFAISSITLPTPSANWCVRAAGDFNGDGKADLVLRNDRTFAIAVWLLDGPTITGGATVASPLAYDIVRTGDYNNDGHPDILLRNISTGSSAGSLVEWQMNGTTITSGVVIATPAAGWSPIARQQPTICL